ncbi:MAG: hydrogenase iron-sulfur subunit [Promethearchaeota archaeon]|jgi:coenzyme F420-reducing hydrogenase delta subunit/DNA-binding transcriptional ArsR family regulator
MSFEPKILGFLCNWCCYAGADLAGVSRMQYPPNIRVIRVMCSGRIDPKFIFESLRVGADGVFIGGCHLGDCHYLEGNYEAVKKFEMVQKFLKLINLDNRVKLEWVSASEGARYAAVITEFTDHIKSLGPSPVGGDNPDKGILDKLRAMEEAAGGDRMRALVGRERKITEQENVYGEKVSIEKFTEIFDSAIMEEYNRNRILVALEKDSRSVKDLAAELEIDPSIVLGHMIILKGRGQVDFGEIVGITPMFYKM